MYYPNHEEPYKIYDARYGHYLFEGSKEELISFIAGAYRDRTNDIIVFHWGESFKKYYLIRDCYSNEIIRYCTCGELNNDKFFQLQDNSGRVLNIMDFEGEAFALYRRKLKRDKNFIPHPYVCTWRGRLRKNPNHRTFKHKNKYRQEPVPYTHKYRGGPWQHAPHTKRIFLMYDNPEYKEFNRGSSRMVPSYWDDKIRRPQRSWKEQSKARHQWQRGNK